MPKVILQVYPALGAEEEMEAPPDRPRQRGLPGMLDGLIELCQAADDLGYWGITHVEHHMHSEGMEISPAPLLLNIHSACYTKRLRHGQLGLVLPAHDPIRLAEEIAIADHMLKGRLFVGMARGYQARWQNILCQRFGVTSTASDQSDGRPAQPPAVRRELQDHEDGLGEGRADVRRARRTRSRIRYEGIPNWPPAKTITGRYGAPGEVDEKGTIKGVCVVPKPYTQPHPQLFQAFGASPGTLLWCGEENVTPTILMGPMETLKSLMRDLHPGRRVQRARHPSLGEGIGVCRTFYIYENGTSQDEIDARIRASVESYEEPVWRGWYLQFGFMEGSRLVGEEGPVPRPDERLPSG